MNMLKILKKMFFLIVAMLSLATAGLGAVCSNPAGQYTFTTSGSYTDSYSGRNFDSGDDVYYNFTIESAGTLKFTRVADNDVSYTYGLATCPTSGGTALNNNDVISFTGPTTLSIRIHSSRNNQGYNFTFVFTAPPKINITPTVSDTEGNSGPKTFTTTVTLSYASTSTVTVNYATANGTATTSNNDYVAKSGILTFTPGQTSKTIDIIVNGDIAIEPDELFYVNLSGQSGATLQTTQTVITITNDDFPQAP
ncbi:hypothetical protein KKG77_03405, partial [bacterium]|nr:hypothetical protein [bacterium]